MSEASRGTTCQGVLLLEPFYGGSHRQLIDLLHKSVPESTLVTLPASKWHWRARTSALYFSCQIPNDHSFSVLFASSVLNLAELVALRPDLAGIRKILYFHENQLVYPVQKQQDRDFQYGYNQILSCLVADAVVFNSGYNQESFLNSIESFLKLMPNRPRKLAERIRPKCQVLYFPIDFPTTLLKPDRTTPLDESQEMSPSHGAHHRHASKHNTDQRSPDCLFARCQYHCFQCHESTLAGTVTRVQSGPSTTSVESKEEGELNEGLETKLDRISLDNQQDIHILSLPSVEGSQDSKDMEPVSSVPVVNHKDPSNSPVEKDDDQNVNCDALPFQSTVEEQHAGESRVIAKGPLISVNTHDEDTSNCCHGNRDYRCADESGEEAGKVMGGRARPLHILWPHRWEHDKNPEQFFSTLFQLCDEDCNFHLSVLGENYLQTPPIFKEAELKLKDNIINWGFVPSKEHYHQILSEADVVVSTANHEFFGVAMNGYFQEHWRALEIHSPNGLEATHFRCYPLCPERLVYPEIFPAEHLYRNPTQLLKKLRRFCRNPHLVRCHEFQADLSKYSWRTLETNYLNLLLET